MKNNIPRPTEEYSFGSWNHCHMEPRKKYLFLCYTVNVSNNMLLAFVNVLMWAPHTFHCRTRLLLVPLALRGGLGVSGSQVRVVKLTGSEGTPCKQLHIAWTLNTHTHTLILAYRDTIQIPIFNKGIVLELMKNCIYKELTFL